MVMGARTNSLSVIDISDDCTCIHPVLAFAAPCGFHLYTHRQYKWTAHVPCLAPQAVQIDSPCASPVPIQFALQVGCQLARHRLLQLGVKRSTTLGELNLQHKQQQYTCNPFQLLL